jgi:hypothetical protein
MYVSADRARKRRRGERLFGIHTFGDPGCPSEYDGPFRDNIRAFLDECAEPELYNIEGMPAWSIALEESDVHGSRVSLLVIEEGMRDSLHPHCDHCRSTSWASGTSWRESLPQLQRPHPTGVGQLPIVRRRGRPRKHFGFAKPPPPRCPSLQWIWSPPAHQW